MTADEASRVLLLNRDYVNRLAQLGHIKAVKRGRIWVFDEADVLRWKAERPGRKPQDHPWRRGMVLGRQNWRCRVYGVPLIDTLPLGEQVCQQMPSRKDLTLCGHSHGRVAMAYEVMLAHYHRVCEERDRLRQQVAHWQTSYEELAKGVMSAPEEMQQVLCDLAAGWHFCPEFDYLFIGPGCPEMESCTCKKGQSP